jgi:HK97 gp10 family phage protein
MKVTVTGIKEIDQALSAMNLAMNHSVLQAANAKAAIPLVNAAHLLAPVGETGNLAESIGTVKTSLKRANVIGEVGVGPRRGGVNKGYHAHFIEYGKTNRDGTKSQAKPFMEPAFERTKEQVLGKINTELSVVLVKTMKRHIKNG